MPRSLVLVMLALLIPTVANADRRLHGRYESRPAEDVLEAYRFHRDGTYEWMSENAEQTGRWHRLWGCGRYELRARTLVLREDKSERSCSHHRAAPEDRVVEHWLLAGRLARGEVVLGGLRFLRSAPATAAAADGPVPTAQAH
jgi:hypothetical protein